MAIMPPLDASQEGGRAATVAVSGVVITLAVISVGLRFYIRISLHAGIQSDDWLILFAVITTLATAILLLVASSIDPIGLWVSDNTDSSYVYTAADQLYLRLAFFALLLYYNIAGATKLSILLMYNRIFFISQAFRWQLLITGSLVAVFWIGCSVATLTNCVPLDWSSVTSVQDPHRCFNSNIFVASSGSCEVLLDVLILAMPISTVSRMTLSFKQKLQVGSIFLIGGLTIVTGVVKVVLGYRPGSWVPSYANSEVWGTVHTGMEIICASLPVYMPLLKRMRKSEFVASIVSLGSCGVGIVNRRKSSNVSGSGSASGGGGRESAVRLPLAPIMMSSRGNNRDGG